MSRVTFSLAECGDEEQLRERTARVWMPSDWIEGARAISLRYDPSYFGACRLKGDETQIIVGRDKLTGHIVGTGGRHVTTTYINGQPVRTAFLSDLRIDPAYRNGWSLARGSALIRELHQADPLPCFTMIYEANVVAIQSLEGARAGLPALLPRGRIAASAIRLGACHPSPVLQGVELRRGTVNDLDNVIQFVNQCRAGYAWAPVLRHRDFLPGGRCDTLRPQDFFLALRDGRICGTIAAWDQSAIRQVHVELPNSQASHLQQSAGSQQLHYVYLAFLAALNDDAAMLRVLMRHACNALCGTQWQYALAAFHEEDSLASLLQEYSARLSMVRLYEVDFDSNTCHRPPSKVDARVEFAMT